MDSYEFGCGVTIIAWHAGAKNSFGTQCAGARVGHKLILQIGLPRAPVFRFGQSHPEAVFNLFFRSRQDQKRARQIHTLERVATLFLGLTLYNRR